MNSIERNTLSRSTTSRRLALIATVASLAAAALPGAASASTEGTTALNFTNYSSVSLTDAAHGSGGGAEITAWSWGMQP